MEFNIDETTVINWDAFSTSELMGILKTLSRALAMQFGSAMYGDGVAPTIEKMALLPQPVPLLRVFKELKTRDVKQKRLAACNVIKASISSGAAVTSDGESVAISFPSADFKFPLYMGIPVVDPVTVTGLGDELGLIVSPTSKLEIMGAALITDNMKVVNGVITPRIIPNGVVVPTKQMETSIGVFSALVTQSMPGLTSDIGVRKMNARGRSMVQKCHELFYEGSTNPKFSALLERLVKTGTGIGVPTVVTQIGDFTKDDVGYYHKIRDGMRSIRGSDNTDNTSCGSATYLPFDIDRDMVKVYQRVTDLVLLLTILGETCLNIVGDDVSKYVTSLMLLRNVGNLHRIGLVSPAKYGWDQELPTGPHDRTILFTNKLCDYSLTYFNDTWVTLNVDTITFVNVDKSAVSAERYMDKPRTIQLGEVVSTTDVKRWLPSCLVHNLMGYYFSRDIKINMPEYKLVDYLELTRKANFIKTFPSLVGVRMFTVIKKVMPFLSISEKFQHVVSKKMAQTAEVVLTSGNFDLGPLVSEFNDVIKARLVQAAKDTFAQENNSGRNYVPPSTAGDPELPPEPPGAETMRFDNFG